MQINSTNGVRKITLKKSELMHLIQARNICGELGQLSHDGDVISHALAVQSSLAKVLEKMDTAAVQSEPDAAATK